MSDAAGLDDLRRVAAAVGIPLPPGRPADLGSLGRTHVWVVGDVVVKCDDRLGSSSMVREASALELLAGSGLPVAEVVAAGEFDDTRRWIVLSRLEGEPPPDAARPAHELSPSLAGQMGALVARLHAAVRPPGFGSWATGSRTFADEQRARGEALLRMGREATIVPEAVLGRVDRLAEASRPAVVERTEPVLAHRDVQPRNVLVDGDRVTALLDFESSGGGDPAEDLKVIGLDWTTDAYAAFIRAYADAGGRLGADATERAAHFVLHWALVVFVYLGRIAPAYLGPAFVALERIESGERPAVPDDLVG
jgi:aminoglycoside phosphotransferase (APT) family kinase protein